MSEDSIHPSYNEVVDALRTQLEDVQFQLTVATLTIEKLRTHITELEEEQEEE